MRRLILTALCVLGLLASAGSLGAAESRYSEWGTDDSSALAALISRLNELIDEAERARAADPRFLGDLRDALAGYERPWRREVLHDDFRDGDYVQNPAWTVAEGEFTVDSNLGLRSVIKPPTAEEQAQAEQQEGDAKDIAKALLSALLAQKEEQKAAAEPTRADIFIRGAITNAFAVEYDLVSKQKSGRLVVDIFQGRLRSAGYRLAYVPGAVPSLELIRFGTRGTAVVDNYSEALALEDGYRHRIRLTRDREALMTVSVDGKERIRVRDRSFRDPFDGVSIVNEGGDYAIREISVFGIE